MLRRCFVLTALILLASCGQKPAEAPTPPPTPPTPPTPAVAATAAPTPEPAPLPEPTPSSGEEPTPHSGDGLPEIPTAAEFPVIEGTPFTVEENEAMPRMSDRFVFWGWSKDGLRYAFETYNPGEGAVSCDMKHDIYVVDAETDEYAPGGHITVAHEEVEPAQGGCQPKDLTTVAQEQRTGLFEKHGIVVGNLHPPVSIDRGKAAFPGGEQKLTFRVLHGSPDDPHGPNAEKGASYYLAVKGSTSTWIVEPGRTRRPWVLGYTPRHLFMSPDGVHAVFIIEREHTAYEGTRLSWMTNGLGLPDWLL